jgi:DNA-binding winged helix-turn-helix (wHTH) protein
MGSYRFTAGREFDVVSGEVRSGGTITRLEPQPAAVLALLAGRAGDVFTHEEIRRAIWGDQTHVNFQDSIHYCVRQVRAALGDRAQDPRFIETIPRGGYRLKADAILPVDIIDATSSGVANPTEAPLPAVTRRSNTRRRLAMACLSAALAAGAAFVERRPNNHHQIAVIVLKTVHDLVF